MKTFNYITPLIRLPDKHRWSLPKILSSTAVIYLFAGLVTVSAETTESSPSLESTKSDSVVNKNAASVNYQTIYRDPETGEFTEPPKVIESEEPALDLSTIEQQLSTSSEGLKIERALKGRMIRLNGRFQEASIVTVDDINQPKAADIGSEEKSSDNANQSADVSKGDAEQEELKDEN